MKAFSILFLCTLCSLCSFGQQWKVETHGQLSYSGLSQVIRGRYCLKKVEFGMGPKINYSRTRLPWTSSPGLSSTVGYKLTEGTRIQTNAFLLYELLPLKQALIHEFYLGYRTSFSLGETWKANQEIGFGGYHESTNSGHNYSLNGLSYCVTLGLSYQL